MFYTLKTFAFFFALQLTLLGTPLGLQAQVDPRIEWKEIETEDAHWIFDAKHQDVAEYYILQFQQAKGEVLPLLKEESGKMTMVLLDNTDLANGSAQVSPYPIMRLFLVRALPNSGIGEFKSPIHELLVHEYTHILNMDPVHGLVAPFGWIFGSVVRPNGILPRWYTEGLAVYTESAISGDGGRLSSQHLEGLARSLTLEEQWDLYPLSELNDPHPDWIGGSRAYLFGGILWESIAREYGDSVIDELNQTFSRRPPYMLNTVLESHLGVDFDEQLHKAYEYWESRSKEQIKKLTSVPQLEGTRITLDTETRTHAPSISPDGLWLATVVDDAEGRGHIELTLRHSSQGFSGYKPKRVIEKTQAQGLTWHPAATGFVYEKLDNYRMYNFYFDLYFYDLQSKESTRLTKGARAHHSCFSQRGETLFFLQNDSGSKNIVAMDWKSKEQTVLYRTNLDTDIRYLSCPNKESLLFVAQTAGEQAHINRLIIKSKKVKTAFDKYPVKFLKLTHRGALFTSNVNGVDNLYLLNKQTAHQPQAMTNTLTRVLQGELDPLDDSLYYSQLTASGPKLHRLEGAQWESLPDSLPQVEPIAQFKTVKTETGKESPKPTPEKLEASGFSPWRYMYPNYLIPFMYLVDGGSLYQVLTSAGDPLGINTLTLTGQWDTLTKKPGLSLSYINRSLPVTIGAGASDFYTYFYATGASIHFTNATFLTSYPLSFLDNMQFQFRWNYSSIEILSNVFSRQGPQAELSYSDVKQKNNDISPSEGWNMQVGHKHFATEIGTTAYDESYLHVGSFWSFFTPKRHVLYLGINGSYADRLNNRFFATGTLAGPFQNPQITNTSFLQRGYPTGVFIGRNLFNANAEYRFPLWDIYSGWTSPPVFLRNLKAAFVFDATTLDGQYSSVLAATPQTARLGRWFTGYGVEFESLVNLGFHVPVSFTLGIYYGEDAESYGGATTFFNIRL